MPSGYIQAGSQAGMNDAINDIRGDVDALQTAPPTIFQTGFPYDPDAIYTIGSDPGVDFGTGFGNDGVGGAATIRRWGSALVLGGSGGVRFNAANLNTYGFYNAPLVTLPAAWAPGTPPGSPDDLPPYMICKAQISHLDGAPGGPVKQTDTNAQLQITPTGITLVTENLNSTLFASGDYLLFSMQRGEFLLAPKGAVFQSPG